MHLLDCSFPAADQFGLQQEKSTQVFSTQNNQRFVFFACECPFIFQSHRQFQALGFPRFPIRILVLTEPHSSLNKKRVTLTYINRNQDLLNKITRFD